MPAAAADAAALRQMIRDRQQMTQHVPGIVKEPMGIGRHLAHGRARRGSAASAK